MKKNTRDRIIQAADTLIYQQGYCATSFAHLADQLKISRGNFYYHFKHKDQILKAVIQFRLANTHKHLKLLESSSLSTIDRLLALNQDLIDNQEDIRQFGCSVTNLINELTRLNHLYRDDAIMIFTLMRTWLRRQFGLMNQKQMADQYALHLLLQRQGITYSAGAVNDDQFIVQQVAILNEWLASL